MYMKILFLRFIIFLQICFCYEYINIELIFTGLKCKECKYRCHRDCESHVPPSCGLPEDLLRHYINQLTKDGSPILTRLPGASTDPQIRIGPGGIQHGVGYNPSMHIDSSSNTSSCNSSTPSSPAGKSFSPFVLVTSANVLKFVSSKVFINIKDLKSTVLEGYL